MAWRGEREEGAQTTQGGCVTDPPLSYSPILNRRAAARAGAAELAARAKARATADAALLGRQAHRRRAEAADGAAAGEPAWARVGGGQAPPTPSTAPPPLTAAWAATEAAWAALPLGTPLHPHAIPWPPPAPPGLLLRAVAAGGRAGGGGTTPATPLSSTARRAAWRALARRYHPDKLAGRLGHHTASPAGVAALERGAGLVVAAGAEV